MQEYRAPDKFPKSMFLPPSHEGPERCQCIVGQEARGAFSSLLLFSNHLEKSKPQDYRALLKPGLSWQAR